jgi:hypothetical protein
MERVQRLPGLLMDHTTNHPCGLFLERMPGVPLLYGT